MYKISFTLKQHTPLIHFQHYQDGATLRATEVKPKLDRFIITQLGNGNYDNGIAIARNNRWLVGDGKKPALDYKLRILPIKSENYKIEEGRNNSFQPFFANIGEEYIGNEKGIVIATEEMQSSIISTNFKLFEKIKQKNTIIDFFALNNFGTRQTKGFGSFSVTSIEKKLVEFPKQLFAYNFQIKIDKSLLKDTFFLYKQIFSKINYFYKTLRSGINESRKPVNNFVPKLYFKSLLYEYVNSQLKEQWDKKTIKANFIQIKQAEECYLHSDAIVCGAAQQSTTHRYKNFRDLFGLSSDEKWGDTFKLTKAHVESDNTGNWILVDKNADNLITRFKSPLVFKIIRTNDFFSVYLKFQIDELTQNIYTNSYFQVANDKGDKFEIPFFRNFEYETYLKWVIKNIDVSKRFSDSTNGNRDDFNYIVDSICAIYTQLKKQIL